MDKKIWGIIIGIIILTSILCITLLGLIFWVSNDNPEDDNTAEDRVEEENEDDDSKREPMSTETPTQSPTAFPSPTQESEEVNWEYQSFEITATYNIYDISFYLPDNDDSQIISSDSFRTTVNVSENTTVSFTHPGEGFPETYQGSESIEEIGNNSYFGDIYEIQESPGVYKYTNNVNFNEDCGNPVRGEIQAPCGVLALTEERILLETTCEGIQSECSKFVLNLEVNEITSRY
jgi:hypothetical protein